MSVIKSGYTRALEAYPGPVIPYPNLITSGSTTGTATNELIDPSASFLSDGITEGDVVYNDTTKQSCKVVNVKDDGKIELSSDLFTSTAEAYRIFKMSDMDTIGNQGCALYAPTSGTISITTIGGDAITIAVIAGAVIPLQVKSIATSSVTNLIALW